MDDFQAMPTEILGQIVSSLNLAELMIISLVSRRMETITQPLRLKEIHLRTCTLTMDIPVDSSNQTDVVVVSSLQRFVHMLLDPRGQMVATHVRSVRLLWVHASQMGYTTQQDVELLSSSPFPIVQRANMKLMNLLVRLPRLRRLHFSIPGEVFICDAFTGWLTTPRLAALQFLQEFSITSIQDSYYIMQYTSLLLLLSLPCIDTINMHRIEISGDPSNSTPASTSTVTKLGFRDMKLSVSVLRGITRVPRALTHFSLCSISINESHDLRDAFSGMQHSLQYLYFHFEYGNNDTDLSPLMLGSLREWPQLRTVKCPILLLLSPDRSNSAPRLADVLPVGICELEIVRNPNLSWIVMNEVVNLLKKCHEVAPALQKVTIFGGPNEEVRVASEAAGIEMAYVWGNVER